MDRQELLDALSASMQDREAGCLLPGYLRPGHVKSQILEAHPREQSTDGARHLLAELASGANMELKRLGDDLWALVAADDLYFVDSLNPRFWLLHSTARKASMQKLVSRHFLPSPGVDSAWLGSQQLGNLAGDHRWVKTSFNSTLLQSDEDGARVPKRLRARVEIDSADDFLKMLSDSEYKAGAVLTALGTVLSDSDLGTASVIADYQGAFLASGTSFHLAAGMLWRTLDAYEQHVKSLEDVFRLEARGTEEHGLMLDGDVALIVLPRRVDDLDALVENLFNSKAPFRLWAVPRKVSEFEWEANAVDLHVGQTLRMELSPEWVRILLGPETCGNTLARLVANLQHRFDARTRAPQALVD